MKTKIALLAAVILFPLFSQALVVVGDSGPSSVYTNGTGAGDNWNYVGSLQGSAPSSVTYISNRWFVTAHHVWDNDVIGRSQTSLDLGGNIYTIDTGSKVAITNASGSEADLCMFRVSEALGLPAGMRSMESTVDSGSSLLMIGNGLDNGGNTGLTWGDGNIYDTAPPGTYTATASFGGRDTTYFLSVYTSANTGSAWAKLYDSGGGAFVDGELAGVMVASNSGIGDGISYITDAGTYGVQINSIAAVPEPAVMTLLSCAGLSCLLINRIRRRLK